jgi:hypothetical protein
MTLNEGRLLIELVLQREMNGGRIKPTEYNTILSEVYIPFVRNIIETNILQKKQVSDTTYDSIKSLRELLIQEAITLYADPSFGYVINLSTLGNTYLYYDSAFCTCGSYIRTIEFVSSEEYERRKSSFSSKSIEYYPIGKVIGTQIHILPRNMIDVSLIYYREPIKPVFDYYIDINLKIQPLAASTTHVWVTGEKDSSGTTHTTGDANWTSLTKELEFGKDIHLDFFNEIMQRMGVKIDNQLVLQYAKTIKSEQEAK